MPDVYCSIARDCTALERVILFPEFRPILIQGTFMLGDQSQIRNFAQSSNRLSEMTDEPVLCKLFSAVRTTSTHSPCFSCGAFTTCSTKSPAVACAKQREAPPTYRSPIANPQRSNQFLNFAFEQHSQDAANSTNISLDMIILDDFKLNRRTYEETSAYTRKSRSTTEGLRFCTRTFWNTHGAAATHHLESLRRNNTVRVGDKSPHPEQRQVPHQPGTSWEQYCELAEQRLMWDHSEKTSLPLQNMTFTGTDRQAPWRSICPASFCIEHSRTMLPPFIQGKDGEPVLEYNIQ